MMLSRIPNPAYVLDETALRRNLSLIEALRKAAHVEILVAFKAFAQWRSFPIFCEYGFNQTTASSLSEARLAKEKMGTRCHCYAPVYSDEDFPTLLNCSKAITFNSLSQFEHFYPQVCRYQTHRITCGLRINPGYSVVETDLYNPCAAGSRLGVPLEQLPSQLPKGIEGIHVHCLCESGADELDGLLRSLRTSFSSYLNQVKWLNLGGGHLVTRQGYDLDRMISLLTDFQASYPHLHLILEPGSAFTWQTGALHSKVLDIVENQGIKTAILNVSFACHMPDCLEMPYQPMVRSAVICDSPTEENSYRLGGNSCLSGDFIGYWRFEKPLQVGDEIVFEDMIHYTTVKTHCFNGVTHPAMVFRQQDGQLQVWKTFGYEDYLNRMN